MHIKPSASTTRPVLYQCICNRSKLSDAERERYHVIARLHPFYDKRQEIRNEGIVTRFDGGIVNGLYSFVTNDIQAIAVFHPGDTITDVYTFDCVGTFKYQCTRSNEIVQKTGSDYRYFYPYSRFDSNSWWSI